MRITALLLSMTLALIAAAPAAAKIGDPVGGFMNHPLVAQLRLVPHSQTGLSGPLAGRTLHRYVSEDRSIVVDLIVAAGAIEQQAMYVPMDMNRGVQVSFFLQDALGSVFGATKGMLAFRAAINNKRETFLSFENLVMRFTPLGDGRLRVVVSRA